MINPIKIKVLRFFPNPSCSVTVTAKRGKKAITVIVLHIIPQKICPTGLLGERLKIDRYTMVTVAEKDRTPTINKIGGELE